MAMIGMAGADPSKQRFQAGAAALTRGGTVLSFRRHAIALQLYSLAACDGFPVIADHAAVGDGPLTATYRVLRQWGDQAPISARRYIRVTADLSARGDGERFLHASSSATEFRQLVHVGDRRQKIR